MTLTRKKPIQEIEIVADFRKEQKKNGPCFLRSFHRIVQDTSLIYEEIVFVATFLPPANKHGIKKVRLVRQKNLLLPGSQNPCYSLFPASLSHDRMIGPESPGNAGGLVGRHTLSCRKVKQGGGAMPELFVGVDVAKDVSSAQGIDGHDEGRFSLKFTMDSEGSYSCGRQL
jgi:hypothetical protein